MAACTTSISVPGAIYTYTEGSNNAGVVSGYSFDASHNSHRFTWNKGTMTTIDYGNGYPNTYLAGINDSGVIVGGYGTNETIVSIFYPWEHGFLYSSGTFSTFDAPFGDVQVTQPRGMNKQGRDCRGLRGWPRNALRLLCKGHAVERSNALGFGRNL